MFSLKFFKIFESIVIVNFECLKKKKKMNKHVTIRYFNEYLQHLEYIQDW